MMSRRMFYQYIVGKTFEFIQNTDELKLSGKKPSSDTLQMDKNGNILFSFKTFPIRKG